MIRFFHVAAVAAFVALSSAPVWAQRAAGPYAGVLGSTGDGEVGHTLDLRGSVHTAWDDRLDGIEDSEGDERFLVGGVSGGVSGGLSHLFRTPRVRWQSSANSSMRIFREGDEPLAATFAGRTGGSTNLNTRTSLSGSAGFSYSPYYEFAPGMDNRLSNAGAFGGGFGLATAAERNTATDATLGLGIQFSRRDTVSVGVNTRRDDFLDQDSGSVRSIGGTASYHHTLTRSLGVHAGVGREEVTYEFDADSRVSNNTIDVGIDYGDTLTFARRTAFSFGTSTSAIRWENDTHYRINGTATLTRGFGRTGSSSLSYSRGSEFRAGFREPLLSDNVNAGVSDQIGRRARWSAQVGYMRGAVGFESDGGNHFNSVNGGAEISTALTRNLALYTDYMYYRYEVPAGSTVFTFLPKFSRHSITAGLSLWVPLLTDKRSRDTR